MLLKTILQTKTCVYKYLTMQERNTKVMRVDIQVQSRGPLLCKLKTDKVLHDKLERKFSAPVII